MPKSRRSSVERYHDRVAHRYDDIYDDAYWQWHDALTWDYLKPHLPRNLEDRVIDLGCGTGKWGLKLLQSGYHVTFLDISREMLDECRAKIDEPHQNRARKEVASAHDSLDEEPATIETNQSPLRKQGGDQDRNHEGATNTKSTRASFIHADLIDLSSIPPASFALATAFGDPICCTSSPTKALKQIRRILRDGGLLVATFDNQLAAIDHYLEKGEPQSLANFLRDGQTKWLTRDQGERFDLHTFTPGDLRKLLDRTGFEVLEMIGKTILPMRHHRQLLESPDSRRAWLKIEKSLSRDPDAIGRASHIQVTCRAIS